MNKPMFCFNKTNEQELIPRSARVFHQTSVTWVRENEFQVPGARSVEYRFKGFCSQRQNFHHKLLHRRLPEQAMRIFQNVLT